MPEALRGFLERFQASGPGPGLDGLSGLATPTPDVLPEGARFLAGSYANQAGSRAYKLYVPGSYPGRPCRWCDAARLHPVARRLRRGHAHEPAGGGAWLPGRLSGPAGVGHISRCWNWFKAEDQRRDAGEPSLIAGITRQVMAEYPVDPRRVYVAGLSAGGAAAASWPRPIPTSTPRSACFRSRRRRRHDMPSAFTAMQGGGATAPPSRSGASRWAGKGGSCRRSCSTATRTGRSTRATATRSSPRPAVPPPAACRATATSRQGRAAGGRGYRRNTHADAAGRAMVEHWVIQGAGHAWPGAAPPAPTPTRKGRMRRGDASLLPGTSASQAAAARPIH